MFDGNSAIKSKTKAVIGGSVNGRYPNQLFIDSMASVILDLQGGTRTSGEVKDVYLLKTKDNQLNYGKNRNKAGFKLSDVLFVIKE